MSFNIFYCFLHNSYSTLIETHEKLLCHGWLTNCSRWTNSSETFLHLEQNQRYTAHNCVMQSSIQHWKKLKKPLSERNFTAEHRRGIFLIFFIGQLLVQSSYVKLFQALYIFFMKMKPLIQVMVDIFNFCEIFYSYSWCKISKMIQGLDWQNLIRKINSLFTKFEFLVGFKTNIIKRST